MPRGFNFRAEQNRQNTPSHNLYESLTVIYDFWKDGTEVSRKMRSSKLNHIDNCFSFYIKNPNENSLQNLKTALTLWKQSKGPGEEWRLNHRNAANIIGTLNDLLFGWQKGRLLTKQTLMANLAKQGSQRVLADIVRGRRIDFKQGLAGKIKEQITEDVGNGICKAKAAAKHKINEIQNKQEWQAGKAGGNPASGLQMGGYRGWHSGMIHGQNPQPKLVIGGHRAGNANGIKNSLKAGIKDFLVEDALNKIIAGGLEGSSIYSLAKGVKELTKTDRETTSLSDVVTSAETIKSYAVTSAETIKNDVASIVNNGNLDQVFFSITDKLGNTNLAKLIGALQTGILDILAETLKEFPLEVIAEAVDYLCSAIPDFLEDLVSAIAPYAGLVTSGVTTAKNIAVESKSAYMFKKAKDHIHSLKSGNASAAGDALVRILKQELAYNSSRVGISSAQFGAKLAGNLADAISFGAPTVSLIVTPSAGIVGTLASLSAQLYTLAIDIHRKIEGNKLIETSNFDPVQLFDKCPILGCYFITCASGMNLTQMIPEEMMRPEWDCVRSLIAKKHILPLVEIAADVMASSRLCVTGGTGKLRGDELAEWAGTHGVFHITGKIEKKIGDNILR